MSELSTSDDWGRSGSEDRQTALAEDDAAERAGMHSDRRRTCGGCRTWADHVHGALSGAVLYDDGREVRADGTTVRVW